MPKRLFYVKESDLDPYQVKIIRRNSDSSLIVQGCAGSGKSILALWKAKQIQDEGKGTYLYVVYAKSLKRFVADGIRQIGINEQNVENYNQCFVWTRDENNKWHQGDWKKGIYDYIIVDEAQDFSKEDILLFKSKARKALLLYGDSAQQLFKFFHDKETISMEAMAYFTNFPTEKLVFNHRLPQKIARLAERINSQNDDLVNRCQNEGIEKPYLIEYNSFEEQMDAIAEIIKARHFEDVGILFKQNDQVKMAAEYLRNKGLTIEAKINDNIDLDFSSSNPKIMTYHSSKGLQFEAVFLPECSASANDDLNPLYVAITRTYQSLYIMHSGNLSSYFNAIPEDIFETTEETEEL